LCRRWTEESRGLRVLDVSKLSSITDYLVLATGPRSRTSAPCAFELEHVLDEQRPGSWPWTHQGSGWTVVMPLSDGHLFTPENRDKYRMELLWRDGGSVALSKILKNNRKSLKIGTMAPFWWSRKQISGGFCPAQKKSSLGLGTENRCYRPRLSRLTNIIHIK